MQTVIPIAVFTACFNDRQLRLSELRAKLVIKQAQAHQIESAINILTDTRIADDTALSVTYQILCANMGP